LVTEGAVGSLVIVEVDPWSEGSCAVFAGPVDEGVGPFAQERLDEPFCFAIGAGPVWPREEMLDPEALESAGVEFGSIARAVISHDPLHGHAPSCEPDERTFEELDAGLGGLVREDLDVRDAAGVIDRDMTALPTGSHLGVRPGRAASSHPMTRPVETAEFLDVDMDELAGMTPAIPVRWLERFQSRQTMQTDPQQHRADGRNCHTQLRGDRGARHPQSTEPPDHYLNRCWRAIRDSFRGRRPVLKDTIPGPPAPQPLIRPPLADPRSVSRVSDRPTLLVNSLTEQAPLTGREPRVTVQFHRVSLDLKA